MRLFAALTACLVFSSGAFAESRPARKAPSPASGPNLKISFKLRCKELSHQGSFVVQAGAQGNYVDGGELADEFDNGSGKPKSIEFHKRAAIVNCTAVLDPNKKNTVRAECQFELSGRLNSANTKRARDLETLQLQTSFEAEEGKPLALIDEPERGVEVVITELK